MSEKLPPKKYNEARLEIPTFLAANLTAEEMAKQWRVSRATAFRYLKKYKTDMFLEQGKANTIAMSILEGKKRILDETVKNFMETVKEKGKAGSKVSPGQLADMAAKTMAVYGEFEKTANRFGFIDPETQRQEHMGMPTKIEVFIPDDIRKKAEEQLRIHSSEHNKKEETENGEKSQV